MEPARPDVTAPSHHAPHPPGGSSGYRYVIEVLVRDRWNNLIGRTTHEKAVYI